MSVSSDKATGPQPPAAIELKGVNKSFGAVHANRDINMTIPAGTIHGIVGENGAGKSTLMNILYGHHQADAGTISIHGRSVKIHSSADAIVNGIGMVHQHFMLVPTFTVLENVMLGSEGGAIIAEGEAAMRAKLKRLSDLYGMTLDPNALVGDLPVGLKQRVEIIKALKGDARILILDEPTGVLTPQEAASLFEILKVLRADGVTVVLITHKLDEIMAITDNVSVMRQGTIVAEKATKDTSPEDLAELMVGRKVLLQVAKNEVQVGKVLLSVEDLGAQSADGVQLLDGLSFEVRAGEILGIAGVAGNGQSELLEILAGMRAPDHGCTRVLGHEIKPGDSVNAQKMRAMGLAHIPEDRHRHGLVLDFEARENTILGAHKREEAGAGLLLDTKSLTGFCETLMERFDVRPRNPHLKASGFSGGNQQKLVIAREMEPEPKVLIIGQPTRGVDIGAIEYIHKALIKRRDDGAAIVMVSVELEEIFALADRILVINNGRQMGLVKREEADEQSIGLLMAGITSNAVTHSP